MSGTLVVAAGVMLTVAPERAPVGVFLALSTVSWPLAIAWRSSLGTALRPAIVWAALAVGLGLISQAWAWSEPLTSGRAGTGHWAYLSSLATLAALITVLNARTPGGGAWAVLMALLVLVFLIPWLEGPGLTRPSAGLARLRLDEPWTLFYVVLVVTGVTNYLPTRYGPAAVCLALGLATEYAGLTRTDWSPERRGRLWSLVPWVLAVVAWTAEWRSRHGPSPSGRCRLEATWLWFRDHWGVVWALRVQERFNRSATTLGWPIRLGWFGLVSITDSTPSVPVGAEETLRGLLRRFTSPARIEQAVGRPATRPCHNPDVGA